MKEESAFGILMPRFVSTERLFGVKAKLDRKYSMDLEYPKYFFSLV